MAKKQIGMLLVLIFSIQGIIRAQGDAFEGIRPEDERAIKGSKEKNAGLGFVTVETEEGERTRWKPLESMGLLGGLNKGSDEQNEERAERKKKSKKSRKHGTRKTKKTKEIVEKSEGDGDLGEYEGE